MEFAILGPLQATAGPATATLARRERILLALLLLHTNQPVTVERISEAIWGQQQPRNATGQVHGTVYRLRKQLAMAGIPEAVILTDPAGYRTQIDPETLDLTQFRQLRNQARTTTSDGEPEQAAAQYRAGLDLWRGQALAGIDSDLIRQAASALDEEHLQAWQECLETELTLGHAGELVAELTELVGQHPHREGLHRLLMLALYRAGRQADALAAYRHARQLLHDELGIEPGPELQQLHQAILNRDPTLDMLSKPSTPRPAGGESAPPRELPAAVSGFTGRADALKALDELLTGALDSIPAPVVISAIDGTAGVGKTALAIHWAHRVADQFPDGQLYLDLRGYSPRVPLRPIEALSALLRSLNTPPDQIPTEETQAAALYRTKLADLRILIVLDNASSVVHVRPLLPGSAGCLVLVTSRDRLTGLVARDGARRLALDVLTPDESRDLLARLLSDERVAAEPQEAGELARACAYLPLALRVAAAALLDNPDRSIAGYVAKLRSRNRLSMLQVDGDEASALRATFDLSYRRLPAEARRLFRLLGLVPGADFAAPAAAALGDLTEDQASAIMARLTSAHLVEQHVPGRYRFHDLLRLYARERIEQDDELDCQEAIHRLLASYVSRADAATESLYKGALRLPAAPSQMPLQATFATTGEALAWLDVERLNLVSAIEYAADHGPRRLAWLLADCLRRYFFVHRHSVDALRAGTAALAAAEQERDLPAQAIMSLGLWDALVSMGRYEAAIERCMAARELARMAGWDDGEGGALMNLGSAYLLMGQLQPARQYLTEALRLYRRTAHREREVRVLTNLGYLHRRLGDLQQDADYCSQQVAIYRELGSAHTDGLSRALVNLGAAELDLGRLNQATEHLTAALTLHREHGDPLVEANALDELANVQLAAGRLEEAAELAHKAMTIVRDLGDPRQESVAWCTLGRVHQEQGQAAVALDYYVRSADAAHRTRARDVEIEALIGLAAAEYRLGRCNEASRHALQVLESARSIGYRVYEGKVLTILAEVRLAQGRHEEACAHARQAVKNHRETGHRLGEANALAALGTALRASGDQRADEHWRAARELFTAIGAPVPDELAGVE